MFVQMLIYSLMYHDEYVEYLLYLCNKFAMYDICDCKAERDEIVPTFYQRLCDPGRGEAIEK